MTLPVVGNTEGELENEGERPGSRFFLGATAGYLPGFEEPYVSLVGGMDLGLQMWGWDSSIFLEIGRIEDGNESEIPFGVSGLDCDLQIVPVTLNMMLEKGIATKTSVYLGAGAGAVFTECIRTTGRDQDVTFVGQVFGGVNYQVGDRSELSVGLRWIYLQDTENYDLRDDLIVETGYRWRF